MRVAVLPGDTGACGHYRLIWPADAVRALRPDWEITVYDPRAVKIERTVAGIRVHGLPWSEIDLLVTQRVGLPAVAELCAFVQERGVSVAMDVDDAMWALDPDNTAYRSWNAPRTARSPLHWSIIDQAAEAADLVTVTTPALAERYGGHGRVEVLPNRIPRMALTVAPPMPRPLVPIAGWSGLLATHPHDPKAVGDAVKVVTAAGLVRPAVMGDSYRTGKMWGTRVIDLPVQPLGMPYYRQLAQLDIGMVPLDLSGSSAVFNRAKSSLKALEMAAVGAAVVASPSPANLEFSQEVPIRIADDPTLWLWHLEELADPQVRAEQVEKQRAAVEAGWVLQDRAEDWAAAWAAAVNHRRDAR